MPANVTFLVALLLLSAGTASAQVASSMRSGGFAGADIIVLRVYNYAHVDPALLLRTETLAAGIMSRARVEVKWVACPLSRDEELAYPDCHDEWGSNSFILNILTPEMSARMSTPGDTLGSAMVPCDDDATSCAIRVFYSKTIKVAESVRVPPERVLADVIVHEIGHVFLGATHSANGIMRGVWGRSDLQAANVDSLEFSTDQSTRLREAIFRRARLREFKQFAETNGD